MSHSHRQNRLVKLIRKLLELSKNNSNANEAGQALSRAQKLMRKYGISELDAESSFVREYQTQKAPSDAVKVPQWMDRLVWVINRAFGCRAYYSWRLGNSGNSHRVVMFCGFGDPGTEPTYGGGFALPGELLGLDTDVPYQSHQSQYDVGAGQARAGSYTAY
ncbi:TPA: DUF2786 domain-containing protein [Yersinia enterocolitica]|nr:DUF2786 domain-containing protein [Yersinia enterocolitica]